MNLLCSSGAIEADSSWRAFRAERLTAQLIVASADAPRSLPAAAAAAAAAAMFSRAFRPRAATRAIGAAASGAAAATFVVGTQQPQRVACAQAKQQPQTQTQQTIDNAVASPASSLAHRRTAAAASSFAHATALALSADGRCAASHTHSASCTLLPSSSLPAVPSSAGPSTDAPLELTPAQQSSCEEFKTKAIASSRKINYIFRAMKKSGCGQTRTRNSVAESKRNVADGCEKRTHAHSLPCALSVVPCLCRRCAEVDPLTFIQCTACGPHMSGALMHAPSGDFATLMCGNRLHSFRDFETVLAHELIHAYDMCRAEINVLDLRHHACMEVRAASLSGDCTYRNEARVGYLYEITGHHSKCVKRKATLSVLSNPACADAAQAKAAVEEVFDRCMADTEPFGAIP